MYTGKLQNSKTPKKTDYTLGNSKTPKLQKRQTINWVPDINFPRYSLFFLEFWSFGVLGFWSFGVLELWSFGVLEFWSFGVLEFWRCIVFFFEFWTFGIPMVILPTLGFQVLKKPKHQKNVIDSQKTNMSNYNICVFSTLYLESNLVILGLYP